MFNNVQLDNIPFNKSSMLAFWIIRITAHWNIYVYGNAIFAPHKRFTTLFHLRRGLRIMPHTCKCLATNEFNIYMTALHTSSKSPRWRKPKLFSTSDDMSGSFALLSFCLICSFYIHPSMCSMLWTTVTNWKLTWDTVHYW